MAAPVCSVSHLLRSLHQRCGLAFRGFHVGKVTTQQSLEPQQGTQQSNLSALLQKKENAVTWDIDFDDTLEHPDYFGVNKLFTVKDLFDARVHYGHKYTSLDDRMKQFVFGIRSEQVIFDLDITAYHLRQALNFVAHIAVRGGVILFVARSPLNSFLIEETALECREFAHTRHWDHNLFTDSSPLFGAVTRLPDLVILFSTLSEGQEEHKAVTDANKLLIPTVAIVDSNCNPNQITYPVPGNDDSPSSIEMYCKVFKEAILRGKKERNERFDRAREEIKAEEAAKVISHRETELAFEKLSQEQAGIAKKNMNKMVDKRKQVIEVGDPENNSSDVSQKADSAHGK